MKETWREVPGFPGYAVSDRGRVRSSRGYLSTYAIKGYPTATLRRGGRAYKSGVHRWMLLAFRGPPPQPKMHAAHLDGNPSNCTLPNLVWATCSENHGHRLRHGTDQNGDKNHRAKLSWQQVHAIRESLASGAKGKHLAAKYGVTPSAICWINRGVNWKGFAMAKKKKRMGRPKGSKNKIALEQPVQAATRGRGRKAAVNGEGGASVALAGIISILESQAPAMRQRIMKATQTFLES